MESVSLSAEASAHGACANQRAPSIPDAFPSRASTQLKSKAARKPLEWVGGED